MSSIDGSYLSPYPLTLIQVTPDLKTVVYCNALRYGGEEEWNFLWNRYLTHNVNTEQVLILGVLGCTRNETLAHGYLRKTITSDSGIRSQDISSIYPSVYNNVYGVDFAINFLSQNFRDIIEFNASVSSVVSGIAGAISSQEQLDKLEQFINDNAEELGSGTTTSALNNLQTAKRNLDWLNTHGSTIMTWIKQQNYRLPTNIVPYHYNVVLKPNLDDDTFQFTGRVEISFNVTENTDRVQLHVNDLEIDEDTIAIEALTVWDSLDNFTTTEDSLRHIYDIKLSDYLIAGRQYKLHLNYKGYHREDMAGFYRSYYYRNGVKRWLASTHFQATSARRAFPCFDEPALKAQFKISIARTEDRHALSNMPVETTEQDDVTGLWWDHFQETPMPMSTYLVAFVVSDFVNLTSDDGKYSTWQRCDAVEQAQYSIDVSPSVMAALENFTELDYFLPKLDQVAIPDFSAGAMENWGLVTYRERNILFVEGVTPSNYKQTTLQVIAHEFAHKWFGNLVSPDWWSYLWLNEGFARYFQYFTPAEVEPDWRLKEQFVVAQVHTAMSVDSLASTHAMSADVGSPTEIRTLFSSISYNKAAAVIRMTEHFITHDNFQEGLVNYLKDRGNASATPDHLFESLNVNNEGHSVKTVLDTWSLQEGYPIITVIRNYDVNNLFRTATVHQERFYLRSSERASNTQEYRWWVPLTYTSQSERNFNSTTTRDWLRVSQESSLITDIGANATEWLIFNIQEIGFYRMNYDDTNGNLIISHLNSDEFTNIHVLFLLMNYDDTNGNLIISHLNSFYRVNYDDTNWNMIISHLNSDQFTDIHVLNRAQLLDDSLNLARAGILDYKTALNLTLYLTRETDYIPWYTALSSFTFLDRRLRGLGDTEHSYFKDYILELMESARQSLGLTEDLSDDHVTKLHRNQILTRQCNYGVQSCIDMATSEFTNLMNNPNNYLVDPDLKTVVYCNALRYGGEEEWNFLWNRYLTHNVNTEQVLILGVLGCTRNETLAHGYLAKTINSDSGIRTQDLSTVSSSVYNNPYGLRGFITNNSAELGTTVTATALNSLQTAQNNLDWLAEHGTTITNWLKSRRYRLPTDILPDRYVIELIPYIDNDNFTFNGRVEIFLNVTEATNAIRLHANDLEINETSVTVEPVVADGTTVEATIQSQAYSEDLQIYTIILSDNLVVGDQYKLSISFLGHLRSDMQGFYRSYYGVEGERRWLASTQFQATHARRAFPCFDEPSFKSKFKISIARTEDRHALSNMPVESSIHDPALGLTWDHFEETPMPMSSYLVAFVVSDFVALNRTLEDTGVVFRNWQRAAAINQSMYSIDISPRIMTYLDNFTGIPYFLPKVDQVAVPDFSAGAMENWGLVTYRERNILHEVGVASAENKQRTADIISHEFAHKWFGNLVSPKWWGHLWLNEGFARYFQYFATAQVETDWRYGEQFVVRQVHQALSSDSLESSHPMTHEVSTPSEVWGMFSTISYAKEVRCELSVSTKEAMELLYLRILRASVIRMAEHCLGSTAFQNGLQEYLSNHGNQTTEPDYLFNVLQSHATGIDIKAILDTWTLQKNYPVITVTRNYGTGEVTVRQERFLLRRSGVSDSHVYRWYVPLTYTTQTQIDFNTTSTKQWLPDSLTQATIGETVSANQWILFNIQQTGFYRVNYDAQNWALLANYLNSDSFTNIHVLNRAQLLDDAFNLARAEILDYTTALEITKYLSRETDYIPWYSALSSLSYLNNRLRGASEYDYYVFKNYLKGLLDLVYTEVGLEVQTSDGHVTKLLRNSISTWACNLGDQTCIDFSRRELAAYMADPENYLVDPDVKSVVFCNGLRYGGEEEWNFLWGQYLKSEVSTEQVLILGILGCTNTESLAHRYLNLTITEDSGIRTQDISLVAPSVYNNPAGVDFAINYLFSHYQDISNYNGSSYSSVISLISGIGGALYNQNQYQRLRDFIEEAGLGTSAWNALATAERNLLWLETNGPSITAWLRSQNYRLPKTIVPDTYSVKLIPYFEGDVFTFDGEVLIVVNVTTATNRITLHVNDLEIEDSNVSVRPLDSAEKLTLGVITRDELRHFLDIFVPSGLAAGQQYEVNIQYQGYLRDDMFGFYRSYFYRKGEKRWLGTTQFEPTNIRRAFPSFDEPSYKAKFKMSIARPADYHSLSNTRRIEQEIPEQTEDGRIWDHFEETPYMSTYLIAFVVSDFDKVTNAAGNVTIWQRKEATPQASYALSISQPTVTAMERLIGHDYQLPKLDQVAIPDFSAGAMENWGIVTYR
uniref:Aminopeptidase N n=1 Tax=Timema cristinae TaxID=61476 RepID=A0A7R9H6F1_TIMCR|nr:unnamed protein product [Timema cristinae]